LPFEPEHDLPCCGGWRRFLFSAEIRSVPCFDYFGPRHPPPVHVFCFPKPLFFFVLSFFFRVVCLSQITQYQGGVPSGPDLFIQKGTLVFSLSAPPFFFLDGLVAFTSIHDSLVPPPPCALHFWPPQFFLFLLLTPWSSKPFFSPGPFRNVFAATSNLGAPTRGGPVLLYFFFLVSDSLLNGDLAIFPVPPSLPLLDVPVAKCISGPLLHGLLCFQAFTPFPLPFLTCFCLFVMFFVFLRHLQNLIFFAFF